MIYHAIAKSEWEKVKQNDEYIHPSLENDGFIRFSLLEQVISIAYYMYSSSENEILLLEVDEKKLASKVLHEDLKLHGRYPHVYGPVNMDAIVNVYPLERETKGIGFILPEKLRKDSIDLKNTNSISI